jgi:hypothetical protein
MSASEQAVNGFVHFQFLFHQSRGILEGKSGHLDPAFLESIFKGLFQKPQGKMDSPTGFHIGHGEGIAKFPGRIAAVMLDKVDLERTGGFLGVFEPGKDGDGAVKEAEGPGSRGSVEFHPLV